MLKRSLLLFVLFSGCAGPNKNFEFDGFDASSVAKMRLEIRNITGSGLEKFNEEELARIFAEISQRFTDAGYPVDYKSSESLNSEQIGSVPGSVKPRASHLLDVSVGTSTITDMPSGLSFGFGNSDPRSRQFQKALTVPITCALNPVKNNSQSISLTERKTTASEIDLIGLNSAEKFEKLRGFFVENIGSTCHNLLSKLGVYPSNPTTLEATNRLLPAVRVETGYESTPSTTDQNEGLTSGSTDIETATVNTMKNPDASGGITSTSSTLQALGLSTLPNASNSSNGKVRDPKLAEPSVSTIQNQAKDWRNKKITIFNQANTVILKFGNDQR